MKRKKPTKSPEDLQREESRKLFDIFVNMYQATADPDYRHNAIELAKTLCAEDERFSLDLAALVEASNRMDQREENISAFKTFSDMFETTGEADYLNHAIGLAKTVYASDKEEVNIMLKKSKVFNEYQAHVLLHKEQQSERVKSTNSGDHSESTQNTSNNEVTQAVETLRDAFVETGDIDYLDNAIGLMEGLAPMDRETLLLYKSLLELRGSQVADAEQRQDLQLGSNEPLDGKDEVSFLNLLTRVIHFHNAFTAYPLQDYYTEIEKALDGSIEHSINADINPEIITEGREYTETIELLVDMFNKTGVISHLNQAISVATFLPPLDKGTIPLLAHLLELRDSYITGSKYASETHLDGPSNLVGLLEKGQKGSSNLSLQDHPAITQVEDTPSNEPSGAEINARLLIFGNIVVQYEHRRLWLASELMERQEFLQQSMRIGQKVDYRASCLCFLKTGYEILLEQHGILKDSDLEKIIRQSEEVIVESAIGHRGRTDCISVIGGLLQAKCEVFGNSADLEQAISIFEQAVEETPTDDPKRVSFSRSLNQAIEARYSYQGSRTDLELLIRRSKEDVARAPTGSMNRAEDLGILGGRLLDGYVRSNSIEDLEQAIKCTEEALATSTNPQDRVTHLWSLGRMLVVRFSLYLDQRDLDRSIELDQEIISILPTGNHHLGGFSSTLGSKFCIKHLISSDPNDLSQAIKWTEKELAQTPTYHASRPFYLYILATILEVEEGPLQDHHRIIRLYNEAWCFQTVFPAIRINMAFAAAKYLIGRELWEDASLFLEGAIKVLPKLSSKLLQRADQEFHLSTLFISQLAAQVISTSFQAGEDATHCLKLLELSRGIIMGLTIDYRSSSSELQAKHPETFKRFNCLRIELDSPIDTKTQETYEAAYLASNNRRIKAARELDEVLALIRKLPGFEGFQRKPRAEDLIAMASEGSIIIVNSTILRSDAIIVTRTGIKGLPLPLFHYTSVKERLGEMPDLVSGRPSTYAWRNSRMESLLLWLWDTAVGPILGELGLLEAAVEKSRPLPRIWWIGVGLLSTAPFHAAGDHSRKSTKNTLNRAISSYIPTIRALSYAREKDLQLPSRNDSQILLVSMPQTPGKRDLKNAPKEVGRIAEIVEGMANITRLDSPSKAKVLKELPSHHFVHFACHGLSDAENPSESHLLLRKNDGSGPGTVDKLTVEMVSNTNIKHAQIAYLSACCTAQNASKALANESIYIASGFQLAGFSHVLATQWFSEDDACLQVSNDFYSLLFKGKAKASQTDISHRIVSASFHRAVKRLRDENRREPIKWAPFIHTGA